MRIMVQRIKNVPVLLYYFEQTYMQFYLYNGCSDIDVEAVTTATPTTSVGSVNRSAKTTNSCKLSWDFTQHDMT